LSQGLEFIRISTQAVKIHQALLLQGLMECTICDRQLTGSASKRRQDIIFIIMHKQIMIADVDIKLIPPGTPSRVVINCPSHLIDPVDQMPDV
jgi:hypothetical protein